MLETLQFVFSKPFYIFLAASLSIFLFLFFLFVINIPLFLTAFRLVSDITLVPKIFSNIIQTILEVSGPLALYSYTAVTILAGINLSLLVFKYRVAKTPDKRSPLVGFGGIFGGALAAGCPSCSISILSLVGVAGGLAVLPLKGVEFSMLGGLALLFSIYYISKSIRYCKACQIYFKRR